MTTLETRHIALMLSSSCASATRTSTLILPAPAPSPVVGSAATSCSSFSRDRPAIATRIDCVPGKVVLGAVLMTSSRMFFPVNPVAPKIVTSYFSAMVDVYDVCDGDGRGC